MPLTVLSLFSGAGGMDLGLERAGFHHLGLVEIGTRQRETLSRQPDWPLLGNGDVNDLAASLRPGDLGIQRGDLSLIAGGPPCQPFSMAAQWAASGRQGMLDDRARTVVSTLALVEEFLPRAILMENVTGFVQGKGSALPFLRDELGRISARHGVDYRLSVRVVNAADYGVPQNRRRAIVVALRDGGEFDWPDRTHESSPMTAWDALHDVRSAAIPPIKGKWAALLPAIPEGSNYQWLTSKGGGPELFGYRTKYWNFLLKLSKDLPSWTLPASPGPSTGPFHWDNRPLSVEEQLRLQSFPDGWELSGDYREQTLQAGNATPPLLAEVLGLALAASMSEGSAKSHSPSLLLNRARRKPSPKPVLPLPAEFRSKVGSKDPHAGAGRGPSPRTSLVG